MAEKNKTDEKGAEENADLKALKEELATLKAENERVKAEREAEKERLASQQTQPDASGAVSEEQWVALEEKFGMERKAIQASWEMMNTVVKPLKEENQRLRQRIEGDQTMQSVRAKASTDKDFKKIADHYDTYMRDLPEEVKADPKRLARESEKAIAYGKGMVGHASIEKPEPIGDDFDDGVESDAGKNDAKKYFGVHTDRKGKIRLEVEPLVDDKYREDNMHPEYEGGVLINDKKDWKEQEARRPVAK